MWVRGIEALPGLWYRVEPVDIVSDTDSSIISVSFFIYPHRIGKVPGDVFGLNQKPETMNHELKTRLASALNPLYHT
jgi:hypothetical protein